MHRLAMNRVAHRVAANRLALGMALRVALVAPCESGAGDEHDGNNRQGGQHLLHKQLLIIKFKQY